MRQLAQGAIRVGGDCVKPSLVAAGVGIGGVRTEGMAVGQMLTRSGWWLAVLWFVLDSFQGALMAEPSVGGRSPILHGVGVLGDSDSDEYQLVVEPGTVTRSAARNWVELLAEYRHVHFGPWSGVERESPRFAGYAYNWGRSGDTLLGQRSQRDLPAQLAGLLPQVRQGEVTLVYVELGDNDFGFGSPDNPGTYEKIARGDLSGPMLDAHLDVLVSKVTDALRDLAAAGSVKFVLSTIQDPGGWPAVGRGRVEGSGRVTQAIRAFNQRLIALADRYRAPVVDVFEIGRLGDGEGPVMGGVRVVPTISATDVAGDPRTFYADGIHYGTLVSGIYANTFLAAVRRAYGVDIALLSDQELLAAAQSAAQARFAYDKTPLTYFDVSKFVVYRPN